MAGRRVIEPDEEPEPDERIPYRTRARIYAMECVTRPLEVAGLEPVLLELIHGDDGMLRRYAGRALPFRERLDAISRQLIDRLEQCGMYAPDFGVAYNAGRMQLVAGWAHSG